MAVSVQQCASMRPNPYFALPGGPGRGLMKECLKLPSGGDTSYAGMVVHEGCLWISYYSSHEEKTAIYLARVLIVN